MYDYFISVIKQELKIGKQYISNFVLGNIYLRIIFVKYLSTLKDSKIKNYIKEENIEKIYEVLKEDYQVGSFYLERIDLFKLLKLMKSHKYKELLKELLENNKDKDNERLKIFENKSDKVLYLNYEEIISNYPQGSKKYDFVMTSLDERKMIYYENYKMLDKMLNKNNNYYNMLNDINLNDYGLVIVNDSESYSRFNNSEENFFDLLYRKFYVQNKYNGKLILKTNFNKISKFPNKWLIRSNLTKVILHKNVSNSTVYMEFNENNNDSISLILLNEELERDNDKLKEIIKTNKVQKNILIKVKPQEIIDNNLRISFKMYQSKNIEEVKKINDIVDENSNYTKQLENLNKKIESEVNKLLERKGA